MKCNLCRAINHEYDVIIKSQFSFCLIPDCPIKFGHVMILPINHVNSLYELSLFEQEDFFILKEKMINRLKELGYSNILTVLHNGPNQGTQEHLHFHLIPCDVGLRDLMNNYENTPYRKNLTPNERLDIKMKILGE